MTATLNQLLAPHSPLVRKLVRHTRALIKEQLPEAVESVDSENVGLGIAEGYKGLIFVISPQKDYVNLGIYDGATLPDPSRLLQGAGKRHRHTKLRQLSDLTSLPLNELIQQAIRRKLGGRAQTGQMSVDPILLDQSTTTEVPIPALAASNEPTIRYRALTELLETPADSSGAKHAREQVRLSQRVRQLLAERKPDGSLPHHPYAKWYGAHWVLVALAQLGYPPGDDELIPLREQVFGWLLSESHQNDIRTIRGRVRVHASQEGNALYSQLALGLADARTEDLAGRLRDWQWPDGGWNCDKNPSATNSSFMETLIPLRALAVHAKLAGDADSKHAVVRAAEVFLKRELFKRQRDGKPIHENFLKLHYPCYWHYDILFGLKVMAEAGFIGDSRCLEALKLLEAKRLADGGFAAEATYYRTGPKAKAGRSLVGWGGASRERMNEFVTMDALAVLKAAGRLSLGNEVHP